VLGGVESQLASDGDTVYAAVNNLGVTYTSDAGLKLGDFSKANGVLVAINQDNGQIRWQHQFDSSPYGAATVSNDVVFTTTFDGTVWALNSKTGDVLWSQKLPAGTNTPVSIAGDTLITAGSFPQGKGQKAEIVAYSLSAPATNTTTTGNTTTSGSTTSASGKAVFSQNCATCHTLAAANASGNVGPNLDDLKPSKAQTQQQVENGGGGMPAFSGRLSKQQIEAVAAYVASVAGKGGSSGNGGQGGTP
jgi:mono/diheme cytochrome c family protein